MASLTDADRARLRDMIEREWVEVSLAGDTDARLGFFSDDLVYMAPDQPMLRSKEELRAFLDAFPPVIDFAQTVLSVTGGDDTAAVVATVEAKLDVEGEEVSATGKFICTATREDDAWRFEALCYNLDAPFG